MSEAKPAAAPAEVTDAAPASPTDRLAKLAGVARFMSRQLDTLANGIDEVALEIEAAAEQDRAGAQTLKQLRKLLTEGG